MFFILALLVSSLNFKLLAYIEYNPKTFPVSVHEQIDAGPPRGPIAFDVERGKAYFYNYLNNSIIIAQGESLKLVPLNLKTSVYDILVDSNNIYLLLSYKGMNLKLEKDYKIIDTIKFDIKGCPLSAFHFRKANKKIFLMCSLDPESVFDVSTKSWVLYKNPKFFDSYYTVLGETADGGLFLARKDTIFIYENHKIEFLLSLTEVPQFVEPLSPPYKVKSGHLYIFFSDEKGAGIYQIR